MNKKLLKLYIFLIITFFASIIIFPNLFLNANNMINYIKIKTMFAFEEKSYNEVNIYEGKGNVIIMFDDGWKTQYTVAYNYMHDKNIRGSIAVIPSLVGESDYMNNSDLYKLYNDNWDLLNHTYSHAILSESKISQQTNEINKVDSWLRKNGFINPNKILIYPEGEYNSRTIAVMKKLNYISGRSVEEGFNSKIPSDFYNIKVKNVLTGIDPDDVKGWIDYTIDNNLTLILLFHKLENGVDKSFMKYNINDFHEIIDYIDRRRDDLNIITYSDWMEIVAHNTNKV